MHVIDAAFSRLKDFLPGRGGTREGIQRDGSQIAGRHQTLQLFRIPALVGSVLVQQIPHREQIAHQDRFTGLDSRLAV